MSKTTKAILSQATAKLAGDIVSLSQQRDSAVSTFRETALKLETINSDLRQRIVDCDELVSFINQQKSSAVLMVSDNDKVRTRILEIIGE